MKWNKKYGLVAGLVFVLLAGATLMAKALNTPKQQQTTKQVSPPPKFRNIAAGKKRKEAFFNYFLPLIEARNAEIAKTRKQLQLWRRERANLHKTLADRIQQLAQKYGLRNFDTTNLQHWEALLRRVDVVPPSLALAQAANESAWGTSRFAREANNYYGQWCFAKGCGLVPKQRGKGQIHEVAKFASPAESVKSYIHNINSHRAYKSLRKMRASMRAAQKPLKGAGLAKGLGSYSQRGDAYIHELQAMIRHNKLQQFDQI